MIVLIAVVWLVKERWRKDRSDYEQYRRTRKALDMHGNDIEELKTNLDLKADRPARSNIRPGSGQSEQYKLLTWESHKVMIRRFILCLWDCHALTGSQ